MNRNASKTSTPILAYFIAIVLIGAVVILVSYAIGQDALWTLIGGFAVFGVIVIAIFFISVLLIRAASVPITKIVDARLAVQKESNRHDEKYLEHGYVREDSGYKPRKQIEAPKIEREAALIDPRHELLLSLCMSTIRAEDYGPLSERLLTADDAQARGGKFADRNNWQMASQYGQDIGYLFTQVGGPPKQQGLKVNSGNPDVTGRTVTDLLEALHARNVILDSAVAALPGTSR